MLHDKTTGTLRHTRLPDEPPEYLARREELRIAEVALMRQQERVAELRRHLPKGATVKDYTFEEGPASLDSGDSPIREVKLSELCSAPDRPLVIYHLMFGKLQTKPCPMCTGFIDGLNGVAQHIAQHIDLAIVAAAALPALRAHARSRGWNKLQLLSAAASKFKYDFGSEDREGNQDSTITVFTRGRDGTIRHFYTAHPWMADDIKERGIDLLSPIWAMMDLTPQGRGDFYTKLEYPATFHA